MAGGSARIRIDLLCVVMLSPEKESQEKKGTASQLRDERTKVKMDLPPSVSWEAFFGVTLSTYVTDKVYRAFGCWLSFAKVQGHL